ncbi:MAG TPA: ATP-binding protein [Solirubrobacteraceae bacterium]|nr:ATP-binding protein [Solirubrobacteraceae bacterium]
MNGASGGPALSFPIHGSTEAPRIARHAVLSRLEHRVADDTAHDIGLVISELVTNSVLHSELSADDTVLMEITVGDDRLAITVTDPGSDSVPRILPRDPARSHGFGLLLVDDISVSWGVRRNPGATQVWCELSLPQGALTAAIEGVS